VILISYDIENGPSSFSLGPENSVRLLSLCIVFIWMSLWLFSVCILMLCPLYFVLFASEYDTSVWPWFGMYLARIKHLRRSGHMYHKEVTSDLTAFIITSTIYNEVQL